MRYKFHYVDKLYNKYKKERNYLSFGNSLHRTLRDFFQTSLEERTYENLEKIYRKNWVRKGYSSEEEERSWGLKGLKILKNFYRKEELNIKPFLIEKSLKGYYRSFGLYGRIDRADKIGENGIIIIDYKTGKIGEDKELSKISAVIYKFLLEKNYHKKVIKVINYYLLLSKKIEFIFNDKEFEDYLNIIAEIGLEILQERDFLPKKSNLCEYCDFLEICPAYK
ncbi:MAG: PD-(D/E)XK nuclease family protein [candidate division WOR-3 bacterium]|nr:PD-(D/E)XK nuclease family protein [candidate division WOR-3 bacterium]